MAKKGHDGMKIDSRTIELFPSRTPGAPLVALIAGDGEGREVLDAVRAETRAEFSLAALEDLRWDDDLSPWPQPALGPGESAFGGRAGSYLGWLTGHALPRVEAALNAPPAYTAIAGYSLGGLFALYALHKSDAFSRAASASGSVWFPGFEEFVRDNPPRRRPDCVYLSVGNKERRAKYATMRTVEDVTRRLADGYRAAGIPAMLEINPGGHFKDTVPRMARAVARMLEGPTGFYIGKPLN